MFYKSKKPFNRKAHKVDAKNAKQGAMFTQSSLQRQFRLYLHR